MTISYKMLTIYVCVHPLLSSAILYKFFPLLFYFSQISHKLSLAQNLVLSPPFLWIIFISMINLLSLPKYYAQFLISHTQKQGHIQYVPKQILGLWCCVKMKPCLGKEWIGILLFKKKNFYGISQISVLSTKLARYLN